VTGRVEAEELLPNDVEEDEDTKAKMEEDDPETETETSRLEELEASDEDDPEETVTETGELDLIEVELTPLEDDEEIVAVATIRTDEEETVLDTEDCVALEELTLLELAEEIEITPTVGELTMPDVLVELDA
jgi:hypothetical protein